MPSAGRLKTGNEDTLVPKRLELALTRNVFHDFVFYFSLLNVFSWLLYLA
jgi:hypothetical protein